MKELLIIQELKVKPTTVILETAVPDTAPYLVTGVGGFTWVPRRSKAGMVRSAFRKDGVSRSQLYQQMLGRIYTHSLEKQWGNIFKASQSAAAHKRFAEFDYAVEDLETISGEEWLPKGLTILIPKEREYLGWVCETEAGIVAISHNPSRAICFMVDNELARKLDQGSDAGRIIAGLPDDAGSE
jgi:hypothetical protein